MIKAYQTEFYGKFKTISEIKNRKHFFFTTIQIISSGGKL